MTLAALALYALVAVGVARSEHDRRSGTWVVSTWMGAAAVGAIWPLMLVVAVSAKAWAVVEEWP